VPTPPELEPFIPRSPLRSPAEAEDDRSMSSSDVHSIGGMSTLSFAKVDGDPGPSRIRNRSSLFGLTTGMESSEDRGPRLRYPSARDRTDGEVSV
jgi:hypothetical protein